MPDSSSLSHSASSLCFAPPQRAGLGTSQAPAQDLPRDRGQDPELPLAFPSAPTATRRCTQMRSLDLGQTAQKPHNNLLKFGAEPPHTASPGKQEPAEWLGAAKGFPRPSGTPGTQLQGGRRWADTECPSHSGITGVHTGLEKGHIWH